MALGQSSVAYLSFKVLWKSVRKLNCGNAQILPTRHYDLKSLFPFPPFYNVRSLMRWNYTIHHSSSEWFNFASLTLPFWSRWGRFCLGSLWKLVKAVLCNICSSTFAQSSRPSAVFFNNNNNNNNNNNTFTSNLNTGRQLLSIGGFEIAYSQTINMTRLYI
jgi:hypothetical protein